MSFRISSTTGMKARETFGKDLENSSLSVSQVDVGNYFCTIFKTGYSAFFGLYLYHWKHQFCDHVFLSSASFSFPIFFPCSVPVKGFQSLRDGFTALDGSPAKESSLLIGKRKPPLCIVVALLHPWSCTLDPLEVSERPVHGMVPWGGLHVTCLSIDDSFPIICDLPNHPLYPSPCLCELFLSLFH